MNTRLETAPPVDGYWGPLDVPFERLHEAYQPNQFEKQPLTRDVFEEFAQDLFPILRDVKLDHEFRTSDDRLWTALWFRYASDHRFLMLFPRFEGQGATGSISLFCEDESPCSNEAESVSKTLTVLLLSDLRDHHSFRRKK